MFSVLDYKNHRKLENFTFEKILGRGSFGVVSLYSDAERHYAIKKISKTRLERNKDVRQLISERVILAKLSNSSAKEFFPKLYWAFEDGCNYYFVLNYLQGGDLYGRMQSLSVSDGKINGKKNLPKNKYTGRFNEFIDGPSDNHIIMAELVHALKYLHSLNIVYGDLKPENVMFDRTGHVVLTDFGLSEILTNDRCEKLAGTLGYMAPELFTMRQFDKSIDFWAFGMMYYEVMNCKTYFIYDSSMHANKFYHDYLESHVFDFIQTEHFNLQDIALCKHLLKTSPRERLVDWNLIILHPAFYNIDWNRIALRNYDLSINSLNLEPSDTRHFSFKDTEDLEFPRSKYFLSNIINFNYSHI